MPKKNAARKSKSRRGDGPIQRSDLCGSQSSDVKNSLTPGAMLGTKNSNTMESCLPSTTDDCFKVTSGDLFKTISSGNSDDCFKVTSGDLYQTISSGNSDDCFKLTSGDLFKTISSGNSDDVIQMIESSNLKDNYFDQKTLDQGLLMACDRGRKLVVQHLLLKGASINAREPLGYTPLLLAVEKGFIEIVRILLDKGADVNVTNRRGDSALTLSVRTCGSKDMVSLLLAQKSVDVNQRNKDGYTCWMKAVEALDFDTLKLLIRSGKKINKDINQLKKPTNKTVSSTLIPERLDTRTFNVHAFISLLEREANEYENTLRHAIFERDLNSVSYLMDYVIVDKNDGRLLIDFMEEIQSKPNEQCILSETELEIIRKLLNNAAEFYLTSSFRADRVLVVAVNIGSCELLELLCQHVTNSRKITTQFTEAIIAVAEKGRCHLLKVLIKYANTNYCLDTSSLESAVEKALKTGNVKIVKILIKNEVTVNVEAGLKIAVKHKRLNSLRFLNDKFSSICRYVIHNKCEGLLHEAVELGDLDIINTLLDLGSDVNRLYHGKPPLMMAETPQVMELLIKRGAEVKQAENKSNINLISYIILRELKKHRPCVKTRGKEENTQPSDTHLKEMVEILLRNGANVNDTDSSGQTPLMAAAKLSDGGYVLKVLVEAGAEVKKADCNGVTALHEAVNSGCLKNVEILIEAGADVNKKNNEGHTVLHNAIDNEDLLKCLLKHGADVEVEDDSGNTALMLAVISYSSYNENSLAVLRLLLEAGSNVNHQNAIGETALMTAALSQNNAVIKILCEANADVKLRTRDNTNDVISILVDRLYRKSQTRGEVFESLFYLIDRGASSSCVSLQNLYYFILKGCLTTVQTLVEAGLGPSDIVTSHVDVSYTDPMRAKMISPFCFALLCNQVTLARYFSDIWYLTISDVSSLTHDHDVRRHLTRRGHKKSLTFVEEFSSQPISLQKLSFVAVSTSIGTGPDRELKFRGLPVPNMFKDKLMFSTGCGPKLKLEDEPQSFVSLSEGLLWNWNILNYNDIFYNDSSDDDEDFDYFYDYNSD